MESAAARARRRSLWGRSRIFWSFVYECTVVIWPFTIPNVSLVDFTVELGKNATAAEINGALEEAANGKMKGILEVTHEELVSVDFRGNPHSSIVDAPMTKVVDGNLAKVFSWYDNEWGFSNRVKDLIFYMAKRDRSAA